MRLLERAGANAIQIEDQDFPKRCGHLDDKTLIPAQEMVGKIKAAVDARHSRETLIIARTDAVAVEGFDRAIARAALYREAGADVLFVEAPRKRARARPHRRADGAIDAADGQYGGGRQDADAGGDRTARRSALPSSSFPAASCARWPRRPRNSTRSLKANGSTDPFRPRMFDFDALNSLIGTPEMLERGKRYEAAAAPDQQETSVSQGMSRMDKLFDTVIKNARVVRPNKTSVDCLDIAIKDGKIARLGPDIQADHAKQVFDAKNRLAFPGCVDAHMHIGIYAPLAQDAVSESKAAAMGGVTSSLNYLRTGHYYLNRGGPYREFMPEVYKQSEGRFWVDYGFHLAPIEASAHR